MGDARELAAGGAGGPLGELVRGACGAGGAAGALLEGELEAALDRALAPRAWAVDFAPALGPLAGFARQVPGVAAALQGEAGAEDEEPEEMFYVVQDADLVERLAAASAEEREGVLGEALYPLVEACQPELAGQLTGMFLEMDPCDVLNLVGGPAALGERVEEALEVLREAGMLTEEVEGDTAAVATQGQGGEDGGGGESAEGSDIGEADSEGGSGPADEEGAAFSP